MFVFYDYVWVRAIAIAIIVLSIYIYFRKKPNKIQRKLIACIIKNGKFDSQNSVYFIDSSVPYCGINFHCFIEYSIVTKKVTFKEIQDMPTISTVSTITMQYEYGAKQQIVEVVMVENTKHSIESSGIIYPATYTDSNRTLYSFESKINTPHMQSICEESVYYMLAHCHFLMMDFGLGLVMFGFKKGIV